MEPTHVGGKGCTFMNSYYNRVLKNRKTLVFIGLIFLIPIFDTWKLLRDLQFRPTLVPEYATFLAGRSMGHFPQIILIWFLPVFLLILCCDNYTKDYKTGYRHAVILRKSRSYYYKTTLFGNMILSFIVMFLSLLLNLFLVYLIFKNGKDFQGLDSGHIYGNKLLSFSMGNPIATNIIYIVIFSVICSLCAGLNTVISWIFPDIKFLYPISFMIWFVHILGDLSLSIVSVIQPFTEVKLADFWPIIIRFFITFILIILFGYFYRMRTDEI